MDKHEKMIHTTACRKSPVYPKTRLLCGEIHRIKNPQALPERLDGDWALLEYVRR